MNRLERIRLHSVYLCSLAYLTRCFGFHAAKESILRLALGFVLILLSSSPAFSDSKKNEFDHDYTFGFKNSPQSTGYYFTKRSGVRAVRSTGFRSGFSELSDYKISSPLQMIEKTEISARERLLSALDSISFKSLPRLDFWDIRLKLRDLRRTPLAPQESLFRGKGSFDAPLSSSRSLTEPRLGKKSLRSRAVSALENFADYSNNLVNTLTPRFISAMQAIFSAETAYAVDLDHEEWQLQNRLQNRPSYSFEKDTMIRF